MNDGALSQTESWKTAGAANRSYADTFKYTAAGAVSSMRLGNGRWESTIFNSRLQPTQIALGSVQNQTNLLKLNYDYGTTANNGNVLSQQITVPTVGNNAGFTAIQTYSYDSLNRLKSAVENINGNQTQTWKQTFQFDRFGNRTFDTANNNTTTLAANCPTNVCNPSANVANNRLIGASYDSSGNTTTDAENRSFVYDAENKQTAVLNSAGQPIGRYIYDGDGKRVKKLSAAEITIFVYDAGGKLVAEYANQIASGNDAKVSYLTTDNLGTPRINTDQSGAVISRHDYQPFGEEALTPQRNNGTGYQLDAVRNQFTGYEKDTETDLDFAQARYFNSGVGRFSSPDSFKNDSHISAPQSWNLYAYARNNPLLYVDRSGKEIWISFYEKNSEGQSIKTALMYKEGTLVDSNGNQYAGNSEIARTALNDIGLLSSARGDDRRSGGDISSSVRALNDDKKQHFLEFEETVNPTDSVSTSSGITSHIGFDLSNPENQSETLVNIAVAIAGQNVLTVNPSANDAIIGNNEVQSQAFLNNSGSTTILTPFEETEVSTAYEVRTANHLKPRFDRRAVDVPLVNLCAQILGGCNQSPQLPPPPPPAPVRPTPTPFLNASSIRN